MPPSIEPSSRKARIFRKYLRSQSILIRLHFSRPSHIRELRGFGACHSHARASVMAWRRNYARRVTARLMKIYSVCAVGVSLPLNLNFFVVVILVWFVCNVGIYCRSGRNVSEKFGEKFCGWLWNSDFTSNFVGLPSVATLMKRDIWKGI